jgi:hypothetical protein
MTIIRVSSERPLFDNAKPPPANLATGLDEMAGDLAGEAETTEVNHGTLQ